MGLMFEAFLDGEKIKTVGPYENNCGAPSVEGVREALIEEGFDPKIKVRVIEWHPPRGIPPRPWRRQRQYILDAEGVIVATLKGRDEDSRREMNADGDFIITAVNAYKEVMEKPAPEPYDYEPMKRS